MHHLRILVGLLRIQQERRVSWRFFPHVARPIPLIVGNASNVVVKDTSVTNSPSCHQVVYQSNNVLHDNIGVGSFSYNSLAPSADSDG
jgi:hypothetical protein